MFAGSFSKLVGVAVGGGDEAVEEDIGVCLGDEGRDGVVDRGTNELDGLVLVVAGRAGPITCRKCMNRGVSEQTRTRARELSRRQSQYPCVQQDNCNCIYLGDNLLLDVSRVWDYEYGRVSSPQYPCVQQDN